MNRIDNLNPEELRAADAVEIACILNELFVEIGKLGKQKRAAIHMWYEARIRDVAERSTSSKQAVLATKQVVDELNALGQARRTQAQVLQSILRSTPV